MHCPICGEKMSNDGELIWHMEQEHGYDPTTLTIPVLFETGDDSTADAPVADSPPPPPLGVSVSDAVVAGDKVR